MVKAVTSLALRLPRSGSPELLTAGPRPEHEGDQGQLHDQETDEDALKVVHRFSPANTMGFSLRRRKFQKTAMMMSAASASP